MVFKGGLYGQQCSDCRKDFDVLLVILKKSKVNPMELEKSFQICKFQFNYIPPFQLKNISLHKDKRLLLFVV